MAMVSSRVDHTGPWLSLNEVAVLADISEEKIRDELDAGVVPRRRLNGTRLAFRPREVFFFRVTKDLPVELAIAHRKALYELLLCRKPENDVWKRTATGLVLTGRITAKFETVPTFRDLAHRLRVYWHGRRRVESRPDVLGGEDVFKGTRASVRHVGELVKKGVSLDELREDFPRLRDEDFEFAAIHASLSRRPGRPRTRLELRPG